MKKEKKKKRRKWLLILLGLMLLTFIFTVFANRRIARVSEPYLYNKVDSVPEAKAVLVLGASKYLKNGPNPYFKYRIEATTELYRAGKIKYIVVSGDNSRKEYNEPQDMKNDLIAQGIPDSVIYLDYAGFRTLDSVIRMYEIFGQNRFIVVSQPFHNERAVFIARKNGLEAFGYNAKDVGNRFGFKTMQREKLARINVYLDMLVGKKPKFLGEKIEIN